MRRLGHVAPLDGLRGIAILLVLGVHANELIPGGGLGVDLFFVLSGFLITSLLLTEWERTEAVSLFGFYRRRALRLLPALFLLVFACVSALSLASLFTSVNVRGSVTLGLAGLLYVTNLLTASGVTPHPRTFIHLWSLAQEEQFYVLWPPLLVLGLRAGAGRRPRSLLFGLAALALIETAVRSVTLAQGVSYWKVWFLPHLHGDPILLGCAMGVAYSFGLVTRVNRVVSLGLLLPAVLCLAFAHPGDSVSYGLGLPVFAVAASIVVLSVSLDPESALATALSVRPLRFLGRISYGLYLWHWPLILLVGWRYGIPLAVVIAILSYRYVELPFLRRKNRASTGTEPRRTPVPVPASA